MMKLIQYNDKFLLHIRYSMITAYRGLSINFFQFRSNERVAIPFQKPFEFNNNKKLYKRVRNMSRAHIYSDTKK